jgi:hypothetical protein
MKDFINRTFVKGLPVVLIVLFIIFVALGNA